MSILLKGAGKPAPFAILTLPLLTAGGRADNAT
jgi:hypothetical protein